MHVCPSPRVHTPAHTPSPGSFTPAPGTPAPCGPHPIPSTVNPGLALRFPKPVRQHQPRVQPAHPARGPLRHPPRVQPARVRTWGGPGCDPQGCEPVLEKPRSPHRCLSGQLWGRAGRCSAVALCSVSGRRWAAGGLGLHTWGCLKAPPDPGGLGTGGDGPGEGVGRALGDLCPGSSYLLRSAPAPPIWGGLPGHGVRYSGKVGQQFTSLNW